MDVKKVVIEPNIRKIIKEEIESLHKLNTPHHLSTEEMINISKTIGYLAEVLSE